MRPFPTTAALLVALVASAGQDPAPGKKTEKVYQATSRIAFNDPLTEPLKPAVPPPSYSPDPLNPKQLQVGTTIYSIATLPAAAPLTLIERKPNVPRGELKRTGFRSNTLGNDRRIWIYTPPGYRTDGEPYPLVRLRCGSTETGRDR